MALKSITMTPAQTSTYDNGGEKAEKLMTALREEAGRQGSAGDKVEIYTADGIVADYVDVD